MLAGQSRRPGCLRLQLWGGSCCPAAYLLCAAQLVSDAQPVAFQHCSSAQLLAGQSHRIGSLRLRLWGESC